MARSCDWSARVEEASRRPRSIGARRLARLLGNLGAAGLGLPAGAAARLGTATRIDFGFPATVIRDTSPPATPGALPS